MTDRSADTADVFAVVASTWAPDEVSASGVLDAETANRLAALLERPPLETGSTLPPLWHELYLRDTATIAELGTDGHPARSPLLPPLQHRRRMFGGSKVEVIQPLLVGDFATRICRVSDVRIREGRSGTLLLVTEQHEWSVGDQPRIKEQRDIVYRRSSDIPPVATSPTSSPDSIVPVGRTIVPDERYLFAYSALTYNIHRIHYDAAYARDVEHHPALVVHGPLLALWCAEYVAANTESVPSRLNYRLTAAAYVGNPVTMVSETTPSGITVEAWSDGRCCARLTATV